MSAHSDSLSFSPYTAMFLRPIKLTLYKGEKAPLAPQERERRY